jgi:CBS domain-containing protein
MEVADVMTQDVVSVGPDASIARAVRLMVDRKLSGLPVVDSAGCMVGIITERDFLRRAELGTERERPSWLEFVLGPGRLADEYVHVHGRKVKDVMTPQVVSTTEDALLDEVVRLMERHQVKRLPVLRGGRLVGIVSRSDLLRALANLANQAPRTASDAEIRSRVLAEFARQRWAALACPEVTVRNGIVLVSGTIVDEAQRRAVRVAVENVPGVKGFEDELE